MPGSAGEPDDTVWAEKELADFMIQLADEPRHYMWVNASPDTLGVMHTYRFRMEHWHRVR